MSGRAAKPLGTTPKPAFAKTMVLCRNGNACRRNRCKFVHAKDPEYPECLRRQGSKVVKPSPLRAAATPFAPATAAPVPAAPVLKPATALAPVLKPAAALAPAALAPAAASRPVDPNANRRAREHNESKWAEEDVPVSRGREHNESKWAEEDMPISRGRAHNESKWAEEDDNVPRGRRSSAYEGKEAEADAENAALFSLSPPTSRRSLNFNSKYNNDDGESKLDESYMVTPLPNERATRKGGKKRVRKTRKGARKH